MTTTPAQRTALPATGTTSTVSGYPKVIWLLLGGSFLVRAAGFAYPFMSHHVAGHGHGVHAVGAVLAAFGVGCIAGQIICGWLCDRFGRRIPLVAALTVAAVVLAALASAHTLPALMVGAAVAGLVYDAPRPVLSAVIGDVIVDPERRARVEAWRLSWMANLGAAIAGGLGGLLADKVGTDLLYVVNAAACAVFAALALIVMPSDRTAAPNLSAVGYRQAFADRRLTLLLVSTLATMSAFMGLLSVIPMIMTARGMDAGSYGLVSLANALAVVVCTPLLSPWLVKHTGNRTRLDVLAAAGLLTAVVMGLAALSHTTTGFVVAAIAIAPSEVAWFIVAAGVMHHIAPPANRGRYHGLWGTTLAAAAVVAPTVAAVSLGLGGQPLVAITTTVIGLIGVAVCRPLAHAMETVRRQAQ